MAKLLLFSQPPLLGEMPRFPGLSGTPRENKGQEAGKEKLSNEGTYDIM